MLSLTDSQTENVKKTAKHTATGTIFFGLLAGASAFLFHQAVMDRLNREAEVATIRTNQEQIEDVHKQIEVRQDVIAFALAPRFVTTWVDQDGGGRELRIESITAETMDIFGVGREQLIGKSPDILVAPEDRTKHQSAIATSGMEVGDQREYDCSAARLDDPSMRIPVHVTIGLMPTVEGEKFVTRVYATGPKFEYTEGGDDAGTSGESDTSK